MQFIHINLKTFFNEELAQFNFFDYKKKPLVLGVASM